MVLLLSRRRSDSNRKALSGDLVTIVRWRAVELAAEYARESLLRDIAKIHGDIKYRALGGAERFCCQQQTALANVISQRLMHHSAEHPLQVPLRIT